MDRIRVEENEFREIKKSQFENKYFSSESFII
jgi:hypothetical protein